MEGLSLPSAGLRSVLCCKPGAYSPCALILVHSFIAGGRSFIHCTLTGNSCCSMGWHRHSSRGQSFPVEQNIPVAHWILQVSEDIAGFEQLRHPGDIFPFLSDRVWECVDVNLCSMHLKLVWFCTLHYWIIATLIYSFMGSECMGYSKFSPLICTEETNKPLRRVVRFV